MKLTWIPASRGLPWHLLVLQRQPPHPVRRASGRLPGRRTCQRLRRPTIYHTSPQLARPTPLIWWIR